MILYTVLLLRTLIQCQILSLEENVVCMDMDCSNADLTQIYSYGSSDFGDQTAFTLQFFIKLISIEQQFIAIIKNGQDQLSIIYENNSIVEKSISGDQISALSFNINKWIAVYITQKNIIYQNYNLQQYQSSNLNFQYDQITQIKLFNDGSGNYLKGYGCCILIYKGLNYLENIIIIQNNQYQDQIIYNTKAPENLININIQEKVQSATTFDYSDYAHIVRLGDFFRINMDDGSDSSDPLLVSDSLNFSSRSYIYIDDMIIGSQFTFEFRLKLSSEQLLNVILMEYNYPSNDIYIKLSGLTLSYQSDQTTAFTLQPSTYIHFCISIIQNLDDLENYYIINFNQFSNTGIMNSQSQRVLSPKKFHNDNGIMKIGSKANQFATEEYFLLYHFRMYEGFFLDTTQSIQTNCAVYLNDRCIICISAYKLSDKHECVPACTQNLIFSATHNQCIRQCSAQCASCNAIDPQKCLSCNSIRTGPPKCSCPNGNFEDYVSPNCRKYIQEQSTQTGILSMQCLQTGEKQQIITFNYQYKIPPSVALFLIGVNQQQFDQEVNVYIGQITESDVQINIKCSFIGQFYKIQWMSGPDTHLLYKEFECQVDSSAGFSGMQQYQLTQSIIQNTNLNTKMFTSLLGWIQQDEQQNQNFKIIQNSLDTTLESNNQLSYIKYATIETDLIPITSQFQQNKIIFASENIPKSIKFAFTLQQISFTQSYGNFNIVVKNRNKTFLEFYSQTLLENFQGVLLFAATKCPFGKICDFKDEYVKSCNLTYSKNCQCNEPNYYINSSNLCDNCDPVCYKCEDLKTKCSQCYQTYYYHVGQCLACDKACKNCNSGESTACIECYEPKILVKNGLLQTCECQPGFYMFENVCFPCLLTCQLCKSIDDCDICPDTREKKNNQCECISGYYDLHQTQCQKCPDVCSSCQSERFCNVCIDGLVLKENQCVCEDEQYLINNHCISCSSPCRNCLSDTICTSCSDDKYLNHQAQTCLCNDSTYLDQTGVCKNCIHPCQNCIISGDICLTCPQDRQLFQQQCICNSGYFEDQKGLCQKCSYICSECDNEITCTKCGVNRFQIECVCHDGFYEMDFQCLKCPNICKNCNNLMQCTSCSEQMILSENICQCTKDYYFDGYQCLSCSSQQGLLEPICNIINCGDGIQSINEECDDGNKIKNDGCSDCRIDKGYQCQNKLLQTSFCYKCQENCIKCDYTAYQINCEQCKEQYYLQNNSCIKCSQFCQQCISQQICTKCSITNTNPDQDGKCPECDEGQQLLDGSCQTVCGDGILGKGEDCDFGQQNGSGGCSLECTQQKGFRCQENLCNKITEEEVNVKYINSTTQILFVIDIVDFQPPQFCNNIEIKIDNFTIDEYVSQFSVANDTCYLQLDYKKTITEQNLIRVQIPLNSRILSSDIKEVVIVPRKKIYYSEQQVEQSKNIKFAQDQFKILIQILGPLLAFLGGFSSYLAILDILSWINNLYYINIQFPLNVQLIFQTTLWDDIQLVPASQLPQFNLPSDPYYRESPPHFMEKGNDPLFINNAFQTFGLWGLYIIGYLLAKVIVSVFRKKQQPIIKILQQVDDDQQQIEENAFKAKKQSKIILKLVNICSPFVDNAFSYFIRLLNLNYLDLLSAIVLHLYSYDINQINYKVILINYIMVFLSLLFCIYITYITWYASNQHIIMLQNRKFIRMYGTIFESIDINNQEAILYSFINLMRKSLYTIFVVLFYNKPLFQTTFCCLVSFINIAFILFQNPFDTKQNLIQIGVPDLCIFILMVIFTICAIDDKVSVLSDLQRFNIGWVIIGIIIVSIMVQFYFILQQIYVDTIIRINWLKEKLKIK